MLMMPEAREKTVIKSGQTQSFKMTSCELLDQSDCPVFSQNDVYQGQSPPRQGAKRISQVGMKLKQCCLQTFTLQNFLNKFPIIHWLPKYRCDTFQSDLIAGLTVGLTVIPQGLAYAQVADLPAQFGLYSAFIGCFIYALMGTSKDITLGPTAILSLMTATFATRVSPVLPSGEKDTTIALLMTFMCGIFQFILGVLKLGILVNFISYPVINAFTTAAAITIGFGQVKNILGLDDIPDDFIDMVYLTFKKLPETRIWDMTMGLISFVLVTLLKIIRDLKWVKARDPENQVSIFHLILRKCLWIIGTASNAIVVISASGVVAILEYRGMTDYIRVTGHIKPGLPEFTLPRFQVDTGNVTLSTGQIFSNLGAGLVIVPLLSLVEAMAVGKAFARVNNYKIDPSQEFLAIGVSNIVSAFFQSYPVTGSFSRTAVNSQSGVRTPMGGVWTGGLVILALCVLTPWFYYIPKSALAAVIISAVIPMVEYHTVIELWRANSKSLPMIEYLTVIELWRANSKSLPMIEYLTVIELWRANSKSLPMIEYLTVIELWRANKFDLVPYFITFICSLLVGIEYGILIGVGISLVMILYPTARPKIEYTYRPGVVIVTPTQGLNFPAAEYMESRALEKSLNGDDAPRHIVLNMEHMTDLDYTAIQSLKTLQVDCGLHNVMLVLTNGQSRVTERIQSANLKNVSMFETISEALTKLETSEDAALTSVACKEEDCRL
ncbi:sodium-independent sulfate anion transporter-like isoform X3 [Biomphalaria glabrata]|uniref:Sodium-independent sulfate anion transporter-like isoform X3 n=1 Tax=Biomphalaria glabrata TaxID=6526 RepID=A0A9W2YEN9_BIOGL|nr:sodium-independent sulfate anion transporter-like isoform X3 [Biomphalaria glabrata]